MIMAPHPLFKQSSITPLHFSFTQNNMLHAVNQDSKVQEQAQNNAIYRFKDEKAFMVDDDDDETGIPSPPLWKTSPQHEKNINYRCLSPSSRVEAIARGQKELMEMVSNMPESFYELTLKDLVEHQPVEVVETEEENFAAGRVSSSIDEPKKEKRNNNQKPQIKRSGSVDNGGFLLKMVFPVSLVSKEKKKMKPRKNDCNASSNSKVSPKPTVTEHTSATNSQSDGTGSTGSTKTSRSSSRSSGSYRSISSRSRRHRRNGFLAFILCRKNKASP